CMDHHPHVFEIAEQLADVVAEVGAGILRLELGDDSADRPFAIAQLEYRGRRRVQLDGALRSQQHVSRPDGIVAKTHTPGETGTVVLSEHPSGTPAAAGPCRGRSHPAAPRADRT